MFQVQFFQYKGILAIFDFKTFKEAEKFKKELYNNFLIPADILQNGVVVES
jgi:hypothetical protein